MFDRRILTALIGMYNRSLADQISSAPLKKDINNKLRRHSLRNFPSDDAARELILQTRQIAETAVPQTKIGNVADKNFAVSGVEGGKEQKATLRV